VNHRDGREPPWARRLRFYVTDGWYDGILNLPDTHWRWRVQYRLERIVLSAMCGVFGHGAIDDQCDNPEHRYCYRCARGMPNADLMSWP
jgi:hypothetical protein